MTSCETAIDDLAIWISQRWDRGFAHKYSIARSSSPVWRTWREKIQPNSRDVWWCESIGQAAKHYSWAPTKPSFEELSEELLLALSRMDEAACLATCDKIFKWGGVARKQTDPSRLWVTQQAASGQLCSSIGRAVELIKPGSIASLEEFDGTRLLMNSAMTKVYAAADPMHATVIYDGRVGAALGLLVRRMLEESGIDRVPESLMFDWGPPSSRKAAELNTRDPSSEVLKFKRLPNTSQNKQADFRRATLSRITNRLLSRVGHLLSEVDKDFKPMDLEKALFMIGYDVRVALV